MPFAVNLPPCVRTCINDLAHMRAGQTVSPIYGDAMQMAVSGYDPAAIAERCGIARAEAELVVALAKSQERLRVAMAEESGSFLKTKRALARFAASCWLAWRWPGCW